MILTQRICVDSWKTYTLKRCISFPCIYTLRRSYPIETVCATSAAADLGAGPPHGVSASAAGRGRDLLTVTLTVADPGPVDLSGCFGRRRGVGLDM